MILAAFIAFAALVALWVLLPSPGVALELSTAYEAIEQESEAEAAA